MSISLTNPLVDIATFEIAEIRKDIARNHRSLYTRRAFAAGEVISGFTWEKIHTTPSYLTVQLNEHEHFELLPTYLECINHSCDPNCFFDLSRKELVALKNIGDGEELSFFYPSTEWDMDQAFKCECGQSNCIGTIKGAMYLSDEVAANYRFSEFIQHKLATRGL